MILLEIMFKSLGIVAAVVLFSAFVAATVHYYKPSRNRKVPK